jgi:hypothetical protein
VFEPIYSLFGPVPTEQVNPQQVGFSNVGQPSTEQVIGLSYPVAEGQLSSSHPVQVRTPADVPSRVGSSTSAKLSGATTKTAEVKASGRTASLGGSNVPNPGLISPQMVPQNLIPAGYVAVDRLPTQRVMVSPGYPVVAMGSTAANPWLTDGDSAYTPDNLQQTIDVLSKDIQQREVKWKELVDEAADGRSRVKVSSAEEAAKTEIENAISRLNKFKTRSEQRIADMEQEAEQDRHHERQRLLAAERCVVFSFNQP